MIRFLIPFLFVAVLCGEDLPITFPADGGVVDVSEYGAVADDDGDDTAAIQAALDAFPNGSRIIYLPPGVFLVRETLRWPAGETESAAQKRTIMQGAGEGLSVLRLPELTSGFESAGNPKAVLWTGGAPAQRFRNSIRDLTIEVGAKNPGAIGLQFNTSRQGSIRQVTIRSLDGAGRIGLDLGHCSEIGPLLAQDVTIEGFEIGISTKGPLNSNTFERITLSGQRRIGWWNYHQMISVHDLISSNRVPSLLNEKDSWGAVTLFGAHLHSRGLDKNTPAIYNQRQMYLRAVDVVGYQPAIIQSDKDRDKGNIVAAGLITEDTSHRNVVSPFRGNTEMAISEAGEIIHLPVKDPPEVPRGNPAVDWINLLQFGADPTGKTDASPFLQRAIDSGAKTIYLPGGAKFQFASVVEIRGPLERIIGLEGWVTTVGHPVWKIVDGKHPEGLRDAPVVLMERFGKEGGESPLLIRHESARTLVLSSVSGLDVDGFGKGDLFLEDVYGHLNQLSAGQSAWCRQLNSEREGLKCRNEGGKLWILGMTAGNTGALIETVQGGITEAVGIFLSSDNGWNADEPAFRIEDSTVSLFGVSERNFNRQPVSFWVKERQGAETKERREIPWVYLSR